MELQKFNKIIKNANSYKNFYDFKFKQIFTNLWQKEIKKYPKAIGIFSKENNIESQIFTYDFKSFGTRFEYNFNIDKVLNLYQQNDFKEHFEIMELINSNGILTNYKRICKYTKYQEDNLKENYYDYNTIFSTSIASENVFVIVDGNHRINKLINKNFKKIRVCNFDYYIAMLSLMTTDEIIEYALLLDLMLIIYNKQRLNSDEYLMSNLNIYGNSEESAYKKVMKYYLSQNNQ